MRKISGIQLGKFPGNRTYIKQNMWETTYHSDSLKIGPSPDCPSWTVVGFVVPEVAVSDDTGLRSPSVRPSVAPYCVGEGRGRQGGREVPDWSQQCVCVCVTFSFLPLRAPAWLFGRAVGRSVVAPKVDMPVG